MSLFLHREPSRNADKGKTTQKTIQDEREANRWQAGQQGRQSRRGESSREQYEQRHAEKENEVSYLGKQGAARAQTVCDHKITDETARDAAVRKAKQRNPKTPEEVGDRCGECGSSEHWPADCPRKMEQEERRRGENAEAVSRIAGEMRTAMAELWEFSEGAI